MTSAGFIALATALLLAPAAARLIYVGCWRENFPTAVRLAIGCMVVTLALGGYLYHA